MICFWRCGPSVHIDRVDLLPKCQSSGIGIRHRANRTYFRSERKNGGGYREKALEPLIRELAMPGAEYR